MQLINTLSGVIKSKQHKNIELPTQPLINCLKSLIISIQYNIFKKNCKIFKYMLFLQSYTGWPLLSCLVAAASLIGGSKEVLSLGLWVVQFSLRNLGNLIIKHFLAFTLICKIILCSSKLIFFYEKKKKQDRSFLSTSPRSTSKLSFLPLLYLQFTNTLLQIIFKYIFDC